jgi:hypothetical protein
VAQVAKAKSNKKTPKATAKPKPKPKAKAKTPALKAKGAKAKKDKPTKPKPTAKKLRAEFVLGVRTREEAEALAETDRPQLAAAVKGILGYDRGELGFDKAIDMLDGERMGLYKLRLERGGTPIWDVWINTVMDDGVVLQAGTNTSSGIGISQTNVYDMELRRDDECAAIEHAIYKGGVDLPAFVEWT